MSHFPQTETWDYMEGNAYPDPDGDQTLLVSYEVHCWSEPHPYGEGSAYEQVSECEAVGYQLDCVEKTYEELVLLFGKDRLDELIEEAMA